MKSVDTEPIVLRDEKEKEIFRQRLEEIVRLGEEADVPIVAFSDDSLPYFSLLSREKKLSIIKSAEDYIVAARQFPPAKRAEMNTKALIKIFLEQNRYKGSEEILSFIKDEYWFEIYSSEARRLSANFYIYSISRIPLENTFVRAWYENFERDNQVTEDFLEIQRMMVAGEVTAAMSHLVQTHEVRDSTNRLRPGPVMNPKVLVPLLDPEGNLVAFIHTFEMTMP